MAGDVPLSTAMISLSTHDFTIKLELGGLTRWLGFADFAKLVSI